MDVNSCNIALVGGKELWEEINDGRLEWSPEQESYLTLLASTHGAHNWNIIAEEMNANLVGTPKSSKQCRERWISKLDPAINRCPWAKQEEAQLILSHMKYQNRWCDITADLKGRHSNTIKNRFYAVFRRVKTRVQSLDYSCKTKLQLVEIHYIVSVMERYLANPLSPTEPKRKRGKDFLYTLVADIAPAQVAIYKAGLATRLPLNAPLEQLLGEILSSARPRQQNLLPAPSVILASSVPMDIGVSSPTLQTEVARRAGQLPYRILFTLPQPHQFEFQDGFSAEDKYFFKENLFTPRKIDTAKSGMLEQISSSHFDGAESVPGNLARVKGGLVDCFSLKDKGSGPVMTDLWRDLFSQQLTPPTQPTQAGAMSWREQS